jgi:cytoskeletal protein RodZ
MKPTVGQQLQLAREQAGISLDDAAHETHIRAHYLQNLEDDHPELLHSAAQARGFLRLYAELLGLSYEALLAEWETPAEAPPVEASAAAETPAEQERKMGFGWLKKLVPQKPGDVSASKPEAQPVDQTPLESPIEGTVENSERAAEETPVETEAPATMAAEPLPEADSETTEVEPVEELSTEAQYPIEDQKEESTGAPRSIFDKSGENTEDGPLEAFPSEETPEEEISVEENPAGSKGFLLRVTQALAGFGHKVSNLLPFLKTRRNSTVGMEADATRSNALPQTSMEIFNQIGTLLQTRRKAMELSLTDIENFTNLKRAFLIAMEDGQFDALPSTVQGRGMLNNYAQFLGMEETAVMDLFSQALQLQREERMRPQRKPEKPAVSVKVNLPERWRKIINPDLIIGSILIVGLFAFIIWGATQVFSHSGGSPTDAPSISEMLQTTPSESPIPNLAQTEQAESTAAAEAATPLPGVAVVEATPTVVATVNTAPLQVVIIAHDRAFLRVTVDGVQSFNGRVVPDNVYTYSGNVSVNLLTGNAAALEVYFNQDYVGSLGDVGEVVSIDFTLDGLITPTPAATLTPTPELPTPEAEATEAAPTEAAPTE